MRWAFQDKHNGDQLYFEIEFKCSYRCDFSLEKHDIFLNFGFNKVELQLQNEFDPYCNKYIYLMKRSYTT